VPTLRLSDAQLFNEAFPTRAVVRLLTMDHRGDRKMNPDGRLKAVRHTGPSSPFSLRAQRVWRRNAALKRLLKETLPSYSFMNTIYG